MCKEFFRKIFRMKRKKPVVTDKELGIEIQKRKAARGILASAPRVESFPNMPKYQFCQCGRSCKRSYRQRTGALYNCTGCHRQFAVMHPVFLRQQMSRAR